MFESKKGYILLTTCAMRSDIHCFELLMSNQKQMLQHLVHLTPITGCKPVRLSNIGACSAKTWSMFIKNNKKYRMYQYLQGLKKSLRMREDEAG